MRPSTASSVYSNDPSLWGTQYATDGLHSFYKNTFIFESQLETSPWIMVTLDGPLLLSFVRVYNRGDCCGKLSLLSCLPPFLHFQKMFHFYSLSCYLSVENNYKLVKKMKVVLKSHLIPIFVGERFHDVAFEVSIDRASFEQRGFFRGPGVTGRMEEVLLDYPAIGQYFRMRITQGSSNYLNFEEIEVYTPY